MILTLDLGTSTTKAGLWERNGLVAVEGVPVATAFPAPGWAEQDPADWTESVVEACARLRGRVGDRWGSVEAIGLTGARQTIALYAADGSELGPALLWSDHRASDGPGRSGTSEAGSPDGGRATSVAAKLGWLERNRAVALHDTAWVLGGRDRVAWWLTGRVATDTTMASASGLYDATGRPDPILAGRILDKLPPVVEPAHILGEVTGGGASLGVAGGTPVVIGAGDRAAEVVGTGAGPEWPMVSWGTTANVSRPVDELPDPVPSALVVTSAAGRGWLLEGGLSAAASLLTWLGSLTGQDPVALSVLAARCPPGAGGVIAAPWLGGARAPWWRPDVAAAFTGISATHGPGELARAVFEAVAWELQRCIERIERIESGSEGNGSVAPVAGLALGGGGARLPVWREVLGGTTGLPLRCRRSGQAASAGAALIASTATGLGWRLDELDPVESTVEPDPGTVARYRALRPAADALVASLLGLGGSPGVTPLHPGDPAPPRRSRSAGPAPPRSPNTSPTWRRRRG